MSRGIIQVRAFQERAWPGNCGAASAEASDGVNQSFTTPTYIRPSVELVTLVITGIAGAGLRPERSVLRKALAQ